MIYVIVMVITTVLKILLTLQFQCKKADAFNFLAFLEGVEDGGEDDGKDGGNDNGEDYGEDIEDAEDEYQATDEHHSMSEGEEEQAISYGEGDKTTMHTSVTYA